MMDIGIGDKEAEQEELNGSIDSDDKLESTDTPHPANATIDGNTFNNIEGARVEIQAQGTALEAFQQVTSSIPWIPFQNDNSPISCDERRLFYDIHGNCKHHVSSSRAV